MARWIRAGYSLIPWTVDEPAAATALWEAGATGIITNRPKELLEAFGVARELESEAERSR
jgi:glycerophosphoryl diester phosphodiesterase